MMLSFIESGIWDVIQLVLIGLVFDSLMLVQFDLARDSNDYDRLFTRDSVIDSIDINIYIFFHVISTIYF